MVAAQRTLFYRQRRVFSSRVVVIREFKCQFKIENITTINRSSAFSDTDSKVYRSTVQTRRRRRTSSS